MSIAERNDTSQDSPASRGAGPSPRAMTLIALMLMLVVGTIALPHLGFAQNTRTGNNVSIGQTENITGDLYVAAGSLDFRGQVSGDANIVASQVKLGGTTHGSVNMAAMAIFRFIGDLYGSLLPRAARANGIRRISLTGNGHSTGDWWPRHLIGCPIGT